MAKRFGGAFSPRPEGNELHHETAMNDRLVALSGGRGRLLYLPPAILLFTSLGQSPGALLTGFAGAAALGLAAFLLQEGLKAEAAYHLRKVARRPALPRKMMASVLTGTGIAAAALSGGTGLIGAVLYGIAAGALHVAAFGIDPLSDKRLSGVDDFQQDRVARVVEAAQVQLGAIRAQIEALGDRGLTDRVARFRATAEGMIRRVEEDPRDLTAARRYLGVYLQGARDATDRFAELYARRRDAQARADYEALLDDLERNFTARTETMLLDDRSAMDLEINVLRDRLRREGVTLHKDEDEHDV